MNFQITKEKYIKVKERKFYEKHNCQDQEQLI